MTQETALFIVPTPIGNLEDITLRAIRVLKEVDVILAEDTRKSGILLKHLEISKPMQSYYAFNEKKVINGIMDRLMSGEKMALISDAGTPAISDPGYLLVNTCLENNISVECLPGATAFVPALVKSGLPTDAFVFEGFLPQKKGRKTKIESFLEERRTMIFYESPYRLLKTLTKFAEVFGDERRVSVSRELTKIYEETINGSLEEVIAYYSNKKVKGEIVIILAGKGR